MTSFLVDVNVWLALSVDRHVHYDEAHRWFAEIGAGRQRFAV